MNSEPSTTQATVQPHSVVTLHYLVSDTMNEVIAQSEPNVPEAFLIGTDGLLPKIQQALLGQSVGYSLKIQLEPDDAFGDYDAQQLRVEAREHFPKELAQGMQFEGLPKGCKPHDDDRFYTVTDMTDDVVVLDGNHPLAGIAVRFELSLIAIRNATEDELERGMPDEANAQSLRVLNKPHSANSHLH
jgi:FKBP-type peptidyl-prolyl cis-trans isomerase SlyD